MIDLVFGLGDGLTSLREAVSVSLLLCGLIAMRNFMSICEVSTLNASSFTMCCATEFLGCLRPKIFMLRCRVMFLSRTPSLILLTRVIKYAFQAF